MPQTRGTEADETRQASRESPSSSVRQRASGRATRELLMRTAERLFGQHGIDGVSLRQIGAAAGQSNNNAVQYHFGNRDNLVASILEWRVTSMEPRRAAMLAAIDATDRTADVKALLSVLCLPHLDLVDEDGNYPFARFLLPYLYRYRAQGMPHPFDRVPELTPALSRAIKLLYRRLHYLPTPLAHFRMTTCVSMFLNALALTEARASPPEGPVTQPEMFAEVLEMMTSALLAPAAPKP